MEIKRTCPIGAECEKAEDGVLHRCRWYIKLQGKDPQSEKEIDEWGCAIEWLPILLVENAQRSRSVAVATESFRNEMVKAQEAFNSVVAGAVRQARQRRGLVSKITGLLGR